MKIRLCLAALLAADALSASAQTPSPDFSWLAGYWLTCDNGREVSETWSDTRGGVLLGNSFTLSKGKPSWELNRIGPSSKGGGWSFFAQPSGQTPTEFIYSAEKSSAKHAVFEDPAHDFPERVIYSRQSDADGGDKLTGRIEGTVNNQLRVIEWRYTAADFNKRCPS